MDEGDECADVASAGWGGHDHKMDEIDHWYNKVVVWVQELVLVSEGGTPDSGHKQECHCKDCEDDYPFVVDTSLCAACACWSDV